MDKFEIARDILAAIGCTVILLLGSLIVGKLVYLILAA